MALPKPIFSYKLNTFYLGRDKKDYSIVDFIGETILQRCVPDERKMLFEKHESEDKKRYESQTNVLYEKSKYRLFK